MSILNPDIRELAAKLPRDGIDPELSFAMSALGGLLTVYLLLNARIERVEIAQAIVRARGK